LARPRPSTALPASKKGGAPAPQPGRCGNAALLRGHAAARYLFSPSPCRNEPAPCRNWPACCRNRPAVCRNREAGRLFEHPGRCKAAPPVDFWLGRAVSAQKGPVRPFLAATGRPEAKTEGVLRHLAGLLRRRGRLKRHRAGWLRQRMVVLPRPRAAKRPPAASLRRTDPEKRHRTTSDHGERAGATPDDVGD
jgi:hypothetical protein